ncbi:MAG: SHOCT domain-containing protein [Desulfonatronovibrionaceae bacterium]
MAWQNLIPCAQYGPGSGPGHWWGSGMMPFGGLGMIIVLVFAAVVVFLLVRLLRSLPQSPERSEPKTREESALDILKKRYARGEIDGDEFKRMKKDIEQG